MKRLVLALVICLGCFGFLEAQDNIWRLLNCDTPFLGAASNGDLFATDEYGCLLRSQDEGGTWTQVNDNHMYQCIAFSPEGRIFVFPTSNMCLQLSDDGGDTWQATTTMASCAMYDVGGLCAPSNDIVVVWATNGETYWTTDGGETWDFASLELDEDSQVSDMIVNAEGDVYVSVWSYSDGDTGIFHSTLSDMQNWEIVADEELNIRDMAFDPEGNVVACGYHIDGSSIGFQHTPGFYLFDGTTLAISDGGIVYRPHFVGNQAVLSYSTDHGEHFTDIGEHLPLVDIAPGGDAYFLIKGHDNHLYFDGGGEYWKCIRDADHIGENFPLENTAWVQFYRSLYEDSTYYQLGIKGDTVVNETAYKKVINCTHLGYPIEGECFGGIREDGDGKCYFMSFVDAIYAPWPLHYDCEANTEYPLYDFSLSVCDVFQTIGLTPHVVFDTAEMELNGSMRKVLWFGNNCDNGNYYDYQWIEGIGSTHSLLYPIQDEPDNGPEYRLVEVWQDEELLYKNPHFEEDFPYDNTRWAIYYQNLYLDWAPYIQIGIKGDTVVEGATYHKVIKCTSYGNVIDGDCFGGIRVEADGKWYFRLFSEENVPQYLYLDMEPNTERLLYDFSLSECDPFYFEGDLYENPEYWMSVFDIDEIEINGSMRRRLWFDSNCEEGDHPYDWNWIEGIGSNFGLLYSIQAFPLDGSSYHLGEVYQDGELIYRDPYFINEPSSFAPQGAEWYFDVFNPWGTHPEYERFFVEGDTIIQGHHCSIINQNFVDTGHEGGEFVYEEDNKVYWFNPTTNAFSTLYNFDAEAGESWYYEVGECSHQVVVDSVGSVTWNGHTYRTQWVRFNEDVQYYSGKIIEGIGYEKGLFPSIYVCDGLEMFDAEEIEYLRCYVNDGEMLYHEGGYDCDETTITPPSHPEWYYEILNENGTITYQYMYQAGDTIINDEPTHILVKINTLYDKGLREEVTHEYVFELNGKLYWWNKRLGLFTVLYDYEAEVGDSWNIFVGTEILTMHVDGVDYIEYEGVSYRVLHVSDPDDLFSGNIVCGIGHLNSFFPERLMNNRDGVRVEGMRCYWNEGELVFKYGDEDCDAVISDLHGVEENGPSTGSGAEETLVVYPNPTNGILFVRTHAVRPYEEYRITNITGQTLLSGNITAETQQIDVSGLPEGMYFISIGSETRKFVVNK